MNIELENKLEDIVKWRRNRKTYRAICELLAREGVKTTPGNLHTWLKRQRKKALKAREELGGIELQPVGGGKPFQSKLTPYFATIKDMRQRRNSWVRIVEYLKTVGITTSASAVYQFMKRHCQRPGGLGMEVNAPKTIDVLAELDDIACKFITFGEKAVADMEKAQAEFIAYGRTMLADITALKKTLTNKQKQ